MSAPKLAAARSSDGPSDTRRVGKVDPFEVCVYETRTGIVRKWLPLADVPDWDRGLNIAGSWSVAVPLDSRELTKDDLDKYADPWYFSWGVCQGQKLWQAGPVKGESYSGGSVTTIYGVGVWSLLSDKRALLNPTRASRAGAAAADADVCFGTGTTSPINSPIPAANRNLALPSIAARLLAIALTEPGGDLPIDPGDQTLPGTAERSYAGYDLGYVGQRMFELTQVEGGPEIEFDPYFVSTDRKVVRHRQLVGNSRLGQLKSTYAWDYGQALADVLFDSDGQNQAHRSFERGAGMDRNTLIGFAQNLNGVTTGNNPNMPLLEDVSTGHSQVELKTTLDSYAAANIATDSGPSLTLKPMVRIAGDNGQNEDTRSPALASVSPGDIAVMRINDHPRLRDGTYTIRVLRLRSARSVVLASMDVQLLRFTPSPV